jgi:hypothetical protein
MRLEKSAAFVRELSPLGLWIRDASIDEYALLLLPRFDCSWILSLRFSAFAEIRASWASFSPICLLSAAYRLTFVADGTGFLRLGRLAEGPVWSFDLLRVKGDFELRRLVG